MFLYGQFSNDHRVGNTVVKALKASQNVMDACTFLCYRILTKTPLRDWTFVNIRQQYYKWNVHNVMDPSSPDSYALTCNTNQIQNL